MYYLNLRDADDDYRCLGRFTTLRDTSVAYHDAITNNVMTDAEYYITDDDGVMYGSHAFATE